MYIHMYGDMKTFIGWVDGASAEALFHVEPIVLDPVGDSTGTGIYQSSLVQHLNLAAPLPLLRVYAVVELLSSVPTLHTPVRRVPR